jgi:hypothetical protein
MDDEVTVKELIQKISDDLLESERERTEIGRRAVFEVAELTVELEFSVSRSRQGKAGVDLRVVNAGGEAARTNERTQRMTLRLVAAGSAMRPTASDGLGQTPSEAPEIRNDSHRSLDYDDALPVRPRLRNQPKK